MTSRPSGRAIEETGRGAYKWKVLVSVVFGIFMVILDTTVVNVAFQTLRQEYGASLSDSQWIISLYVLSLGISTPLAGYLGDRFGMKRIYVGGLAIFVLGSFLCGIAPNLWFLIAARGLQGFGGGIALPLGTALLFSAFPPEEQGMALGFFGIALVVAPALGPILGGWLVVQNLWRLIFFINIPIGLTGVLLASRFLRRQPREAAGSFDLLGLVTEIVGFGAVLYAASIVADQGWTSPNVLMWFGIGAIGLLLFAWVELFVAKEPLLDLRLFKNRIFLNASLVGYVSVLALFGAEFLLPLYLQALRGRTAFETGFILLPMAIASGVMTPIAGRLYDRVGPRPLVGAGFAILTINTWQLSQLQANTSIGWILFLLALRGMAVGMTVQTTFVTALSVVPLRRVSRASSLVNATRQVVQSIGVAILATILVSTLSPQVRTLQQQFQDAPAASAAAQVGICEIASRSGSSAIGEPRLSRPGAGLVLAALQGDTPLTYAPPAFQGGPAAGPLIQKACEENVRGFEKAYQLTFYAAIAALLIGLMLPGWPLKFAGRRAADRPPPGH